MSGQLAPLATDVRARRVSAQELARSALERIERQRDLNAVVALRPEADILAEARAVDARVARGEDPGPLAGLPFLVKDIEDLAGLPTTFGSLLFADAPPAAGDGVQATRLRAAGAVPVGKANTSELAMTAVTANPLFGATRDPWAPDWSPGGSSGGSAAAVAAGLVPIATATDVGGSIRIPAALCGLVGLKPSSGRVGRDPMLATPEMNHMGPLATSVADAALMLDVLAGPVAGDPFSLPRMPLGRLRLPTRVLACERLVPHGPLGEPVRGLFEGALAAVEHELGLTVERVEQSDVFPSGYDSDDWFRIIAVDQLAILGRERVEREVERCGPEVREELSAALAIGVDEYSAARRRRFAYALDLDRLLGSDTVLLTPTLTVEGWTLDGRLPGSDRIGLPAWVFNTDAINFGRQPAASLPAGRGPHGVPFGLHVVGPAFEDELVLGFAAAWEAARPWPPVADGYEPFGEG